MKKIDHKMNDFKENLLVNIPNDCIIFVGFIPRNIVISQVVKYLIVEYSASVDMYDYFNVKILR